MQSNLSLTALLFLLVTGVSLLILPRKWLGVPLIAGACYMTIGQSVEVGPLSFSVLRLLALIAICRVIISPNIKIVHFHRLDGLMLLWAVVFLLSASLHSDPASDAVTKLGEIYDACSLYFLVRCVCTSIEDVSRACKSILILLVPVGLSMTYERAAMRNPFAVFGGVPEAPLVRDGKARAQGPFRHPILAGTVGAAALPMAVHFWRSSRTVAILGGAAGGAMMLASGSSGPVMTALAGFIGMFMWRFKTHMASVRAGIVCVYLTLELLMNRPAYYLMIRLDVTGSSTGWHRAALIESAFDHFDEWWLAGTDYTRHWMPYGVSYSPNHADITNQYIVMGVNGGFLTMLLFIALTVVGFRSVGSAVKQLSIEDTVASKLGWTLGATLFAHCVTFVSVAYFDQSRLYFYLLLALIGSLTSHLAQRSPLESSIVETANQPPLLYWGDSVPPGRWYMPKGPEDNEVVSVKHN